MEKYNELNTGNLTFFTSTEKEIINFILKKDSLVLFIKEINFNSYKNIYVYLKNIKTRELLFAPTKAINNSLVIDLKDLNKLCTDYEYSIVISLEDNINKIIYHPVYNEINTNKELLTDSNSKNIKWYLRVTNNRKLRLSTIVLFSNIINS